jgi:hypothetical protein
VALGPSTLALRRIRRGIKLLDAKKPEWREKLHAKLVHDGVKLDLSNPDECVLGLAYANGVRDPFTVGLVSLGISEEDHDRFHGFEASPGLDIDYGLLNRLWESEFIRLGIVPTGKHVTVDL